MPDRIIFHADCNNFFASCECLERPELKDVPLAVAGDPEKRVGVVVAKNELAKKYGVRTTDTVYQAKRKCPQLVLVPPRHGYYAAVSRRVNAIYAEYTQYVEPASIDESYLDMTEAAAYLRLEPRALADQLRARVREEIGITISVGVSYCKIFAKMGSDYKKPDATTVITRENYRDILWPLPVSDLLFAGKSAAEALRRRGIETIEALAVQPESAMRALLGKHGELLWRYANGIDEEPVRQLGEEREIKSVSRGRTFPRDLVTEDEVKAGIRALADEVARTLRRHGLKGAVVFVQIRRPDMRTISRQTQLEHYTHLQHEIQETALRLVRENWRVGPAQPIRALTVGVTKLVPENEAVEQLSLFDLDPGAGGEQSARERRERLEAAVEAVRRKHGDGSITLGYRESEATGVGRGEEKKGHGED